MSLPAAYPLPIYLSWVACLTASVQLAIEQVSGNFGNDTPFELMHVEVAKCDALLELEVTPEEK